MSNVRYTTVGDNDDADEGMRCCRLKCFQKLSTDKDDLTYTFAGNTTDTDDDDDENASVSTRTNAGTSNASKRHRIAAFIREHSLFEPNVSGGRQHFYYVHLNGKGRELVCRSFFMFMYGWTRSDMISVVSFLMREEDRDKMNDAHPNRAWAPSDVDRRSYIVLERAQELGVLPRQASIAKHAHFTCKLNALYLARTNANITHWRAYADMFQNESAYWSMFYLCDLSDEITFKPLNYVNMASVTKACLPEAAAALCTLESKICEYDVRECEKHALSEDALIALCKAAAVVDVHRETLYGTACLPLPMHPFAIMRVLPSAHALYAHASLRERVLRERLVPSATPRAKRPRTMLDGSDLSRIDLSTHCSFCDLLSLEIWKATKNTEHDNFAERSTHSLKVHRFVNASASYAQERAIESLSAFNALCWRTAAREVCAKRGERFNIKHMYYSLEMGVPDICLPRSNWDSAVNGTALLPFVAYSCARDDEDAPRMRLCTLIEAPSLDASRTYLRCVVQMKLLLWFERLFNVLRERYDALVDGAPEEKERVVHVTLCVRSSPLGTMGGYVQLYGMRLLRLLASHLAVHCLQQLYVVHLQWHWLPTQHCAVWFAPVVVGDALQQIANTYAYTGAAQFVAAARAHMTNTEFGIFDEKLFACEMEDAPPMHITPLAASAAPHATSTLLAVAVSRPCPVLGVHIPPIVCDILCVSEARGLHVDLRDKSGAYLQRVSAPMQKFLEDVLSTDAQFQSALHEREKFDEAFASLYSARNAPPFHRRMKASIKEGSFRTFAYMSECEETFVYEHGVLSAAMFTFAEKSCTAADGDESDLLRRAQAIRYKNVSSTKLLCDYTFAQLRAACADAQWLLYIDSSKMLWKLQQIQRNCNDDGRAIPFARAEEPAQPHAEMAMQYLLRLQKPSVMKAKRKRNFVADDGEQQQPNGTEAAATTSEDAHDALHEIVQEETLENSAGAAQE